MADMDIDPPVLTVSKGKSKDDSKDGKKRFEVKKLPFGHGTSLSTTALSAGTTSWISVLNVKPTKFLHPMKTAMLHGVFVTTHSTSIASLDGLRREMSVHWTTVNGSCRNTDGRSPAQKSISCSLAMLYITLPHFLEAVATFMSKYLIHVSLGYMGLHKNIGVIVRYKLHDTVWLMRQ